MEVVVEPDNPPSIQQRKAPDPFFNPLRGVVAAIPCLEIQVFYVRVSCPFLEQAPDLLSMKCSAKLSGSPYEINRSRVSSTHEATLALRRDRMDVERAEAIYVCTENLRTTGPLAFKICYQDDATLVCGTVKNTDAGHDEESIGSLGWLMECSCALLSPVCNFLKAKGDLCVLPSIEVCIAGRFSGSPVILTQTVHLVARKRHSRRHTLDVIPEVEELERSKDSVNLATISCQMEEHTIYQELDLISARPLGMYGPHVCLEDDDGDLTWFNTGVRVGVGIGLGMCVGLGIGVGLLMRGYQATTRALRRKLL